MTELVDEMRKLLVEWKQFAQNLYDNSDHTEDDLVYADAMRHCAQELKERIEAYE